MVPWQGGKSMEAETGGGDEGTVPDEQSLTEIPNIN